MSNPHQKIQLSEAAGPLFMLSSALLFTALNLIIKLLDPRFRIWDIGFYRFAGGILLILLIFGRRRNPYRGRPVWLLMVRGCTGTLAFLSLISAIRLLPVSTAMVIFYTYPAMAAVFAFAIYGERVTPASVLCMAATVVGVGIFFNFQLQGGALGQLLALAGAAFAGLTVTLIRALKATNSSETIYLYFCTMGLMVTLPIFATGPVVPASGPEWLMCAGIVLCSLSAQLLMNHGFGYCRGWEGGLFMSSEVVFTALVGILLLDDPVSWRFWTGSTLIIGSVVVLNAANHRRRT